MKTMGETERGLEHPGGLRAFVRGLPLLLLLFFFFLLKVKREVIERPELSGVALYDCVAFVLALLECDCSLL